MLYINTIGYEIQRLDAYPLPVSSICKLIIKHRDCPGITAKQISVIQNSLSGTIPDQIIQAIMQTAYYFEFGDITPETLKGVSKNELKPIELIFSNYYKL